MKHMDWIKVPTDNVLYSEYKDSELIVLIKYQALYCQLEIEPSGVQLCRVFNKRQQDFLRSNAEVVQKLIKSQIKVVTTKRNRDKDNYQRKQYINENSASGTPTESLRTGVAEKRREEKNKKDTKVSKKEKILFNTINDFDSLFSYWEQNKKGTKYKVDSRGRMKDKLISLTNDNLEFAKEVILNSIDNGYQGFCSGNELFIKPSKPTIQKTRKSISEIMKEIDNGK